MSPKQIKHYRALWGDARKALRARGLSPQAADAERHAIHMRELGEDKSSLWLTDDEFTRIKRVFVALARPADVGAQQAQEVMPETRKKVFIRHVLTALEADEQYARATLAQMNRGGRIGQPWAEDRAYVRDAGGTKVGFDYSYTHEGEPVRQQLGLDDLDESELKKVIVALKKECKRRWRTKEDLLRALDAVVGHERDAGAAASAHVQGVLHWTQWPAGGLEKLNYETLLMVLSALRTLPARSGEAEQAEQDDGDPF